MSQQDEFVIYSCFNVIYLITRKYEYLQRSDELYAEIFEVGNIFHDPLLFYLIKVIEDIQKGDHKPKMMSLLVI